MALLPAEAVPWLIGLLGAFVGSFLNVCIHRMPAHRSIVFPGSACPRCGAAIPLWHNVPVLSWLLLRGRCASCRGPISLRYPFVEAATSALFLAAWWRFGTGIALARALVFISALIVLFFTDLDQRVLPDLVTLPGIAAGLAFSALGVGAPRPLASLAAAAGGGGALWLLGRLWRFVRPGIPSAMGMGDVKMMGAIGAFLGPGGAFLTVFLGSLAGTLLFAFSRILAALLPRRAPGGGPIRRGLEAAGFFVEGRSAGLLDQIPFGSMLAIGAGVALFCGERMIRAYLDLAGFGA